MRFTKYVLFAMLLAAGSIGSVSGQQAQDPGVIAGPYGVPRLVQDDTGAWQEPMEVFHNTKVEVFIPDITGPAWAAWHVQKTGEHDFTYFVYVYTYDRGMRRTARELIYVDTRKPDRIVSQNMFQREAIDVSGNPTLAKITAKITAIVRPEAIRQPNEIRTLQDYVRQEELAASRMAVCSGPGVQNPDCDLSNSDPQKKYPTYSRPTPRMIPGAVPGVNCGVGTNKSCCCANESTPSNIGVTNSANGVVSQNRAGSAVVMGSDSGSGYGPDNRGDAAAGTVYRVGGSITAPVPLNTVEAQYSEEARSAKYEGVCVIQMIIDTHGDPQDPRVIHGLKYGLDEKALDAVRKYRFKPAMKDGRTPVPVIITVDVNFKLY